MTAQAEGRTELQRGGPLATGHLQCSAKAGLGSGAAVAVTVLVVRCRQQDLAFQPMELCLPIALADAFHLSAGFGQPLSGRVDAAGAKAQLSEEGQQCGR